MNIKSIFSRFTRRAVPQGVMRPVSYLRKDRFLDLLEADAFAALDAHDLTAYDWCVNEIAAVENMTCAEYRYYAEQRLAVATFVYVPAQQAAQLSLL